MNKLFSKSFFIIGIIILGLANQKLEAHNYIPPNQTTWQEQLENDMFLKMDNTNTENIQKQSFLKRLFRFEWLNKAHFNTENIKKKLFLALVIVLAGPIGGHRLILGTKPHVPIIYALTLGGGLGLIPLIDLIMIVSSKDVSKYKNNSKIIMWAD